MDRKSGESSHSAPLTKNQIDKTYHDLISDVSVITKQKSYFSRGEKGKNDTVLLNSLNVSFTDNKNLPISTNWEKLPIRKPSILKSKKDNFADFPSENNLSLGELDSLNWTESSLYSSPNQKNLELMENAMKSNNTAVSSKVNPYPSSYLYNNSFEPVFNDLPSPGHKLENKPWYVSYYKDSSNSIIDDKKDRKISDCNPREFDLSCITNYTEKPTLIDQRLSMRAHFLNPARKQEMAQIDQCFLIHLYIESKNSHLGPFLYEIHPKMTLKLLKMQVEKELNISSENQKWIFFDQLAENDDLTMREYGLFPHSSVFLYLNNTKSKSINISKLTEADIHETIKPTLKSSIATTTDYLMGIEAKNAKTPEKNKNSKYLIKNTFPENDPSFPCQLKFNKNHNLKRNLFQPHSPKLLKDNPNIYSKQISHEPSENPSLPIQSVLPKRNKGNSSHCCNTMPFLANPNYKIGLLEEEMNVISSNSFIFPATFSTEINQEVFESTHIENREEDLGFKTDNPRCKANILLNDYNEMNSTCMKLKDFSLIDEAPKKSILNRLKLKCRSELESISRQAHKKQSFPAVFKNDNDVKLNKIIDQNYILRSHNSNHSMQIMDKTDKDAEREKLTIVDFPEEKADMIPSMDCFLPKVDKSLVDHDEKTNNLSSHVIIKDLQETVENIDGIFSQCNSTTENAEQICDKESVSEIVTEILLPSEKTPAQNFEFWLNLDNLSLVKNDVSFMCSICLCEIESGNGIILHECLHMFCMDCLRRSVEYAEESLIKCPFRDEEYSCQSYLQQREIRALVSDDVYEKYLQRSIVTAESVAEKSFHCKTPDCRGWCMFEDNINIFHCPVCLHYNCINCNAIHEGLNCKQYQDKLRNQNKVDKDSEKTLAFLNKMIKDGKAMKCPKCDLILMKRWGCDWLKCSICHTEVCWITKGPRWGPAGQGDISSGCRCGVNGVKCHPSCSYCH